MKKIVVSILFIFLFTFNLNVKALELDLNSKNIMVYNLNDNEIIYKEKENEKVAIASLTKIMTVLVSIENIDDYEEKIEFPSYDKSKLWDYTKAGFVVGEKYTYNDLLYAAILPSAADATEGLANLISESPEEFVKLMNKKAKQLKLNNTHFSNTYGDDPDNYSTLSDLLTLLKYALKNEKFYEIFTSKKYKMSNGKTVSSSVTYYAKNYDIDTDNIKGAKTGYTTIAGLCMASLYEEGDMKYIIITLGAPSSNTPYQVMDNVNIGKYVYENYEYKKIIEKDEEIVELTLFGPFKKKINAEESVKKYLLKDKKLEKEYEGKTKLSKNNNVKDTLGKYIIKYNGEKIYELEIKIEDTFEYKFWLFINKYIIYMVLGLLFVIICLILKKKRHKKKRKRSITLDKY